MVRPLTLMRHVQTVADMMKGKTPEEIRKTFNQKLSVSLLKVRGRQAIKDLLIQMEQERQRELSGIVECHVVSRFSHRGRLQGGIDKGEDPRNAAITELRKKHELLLAKLGIVKELLNMWPELCSTCDSSNTSPLYSAVVQDHLDVVNAILDADERCARIVRKNGKTSLHIIARYGVFRIVKALLDRDPGIVCIKDKKGQTALHMAVKGQDPAVVEELLLADLSILNERDKKGNTDVHMARRKCRPENCEIHPQFSKKK